MAVVLIEAQLRVRAGGAVMSCVVLPVMVASAADARKMAIPVPDEFVECLLGLLDEVAERLHCLATFGLLRPLLFRLFALALLLSPQSLSSVLFGLRFGNGGGALIAADDLPIAYWVEPLAA